MASRNRIYAEQGRQNPNGSGEDPGAIARWSSGPSSRAHREDQRNQQRSGQRDYRADQRDSHGHDNRSYDNRRYDNTAYEYRNYGYHDGGYRGHGRGAGPQHAWYRGDRLPTYYRSRSYVVDDWRGHHLYAPPQGYHWVQSGGDYLLVAVATGIIASILLNQ